MKEFKNVYLFLLIIILLGIAMLVYIKDSNNAEWTVNLLPENLNLNQEFALEVWKDILSIHFPENNSTERIKAKDCIQLLVEVLAARMKTGEQNFKDIIVTNKDIKKALSLLNQTSPIVADRFVGNWDGHCSVPELNEFINYKETRFQVGVVREMIITYYPF